MADTTLVRRAEDDVGDLRKKPQTPNINKQQVLLKSDCQIGLTYIELDDAIIPPMISL